MRLVATEPSPEHRAALALHALTDMDRAWVLDALSSEQRNRLCPLLRELEELGIPRDDRLLETVAAGEPDAPRPRDALEDLTGAEVRRLAQVLAGEPPRLIRALLASRPWPWRAQLLSCLPAEVACEAARPMSADLPAGALQAALIAQAANALRTIPADAVPAGRWAAWRGRLAALRRKH